MIRSSRIMAGVVTLAVCIAGCGSRPPPELRSPESLTLYSIDGRDLDTVPPASRPATDEQFHGYPVLGRLEIETPGDRGKIVSALNQGLADTDGQVAACFWPRHGIRAVQNGVTVDYVICFECSQLWIYPSGGDESGFADPQHKPVSRTPQPVFNEFLREAGIPIAPGTHGHSGSD